MLFCMSSAGFVLHLLSTKLSIQISLATTLFFVDVFNSEIAET